MLHRWMRQLLTCFKNFRQGMHNYTHNTLHQPSMMKRHWAPKKTHELEKPLCGRPRKPRPLTRHLHTCFCLVGRARRTNSFIVSTRLHVVVRCFCWIELEGKLPTPHLHMTSFYDETDDESYSSFRCRHHILFTIHAFLIYLVYYLHVAL